MVLNADGHIVEARGRIVVFILPQRLPVMDFRVIHDGPITVGAGLVPALPGAVWPPGNVGAGLVPAHFASGIMIPEFPGTHEGYPYVPARGRFRPKRAVGAGLVPALAVPGL